MDWIRRNWPDLVIGVALVSVIGAIVATLMTGGSIFNLVGRSPLSNPISNIDENKSPDMVPIIKESLPRISPVPLGDIYDENEIEVEVPTAMERRDLEEDSPTPVPSQDLGIVEEEALGLVPSIGDTSSPTDSQETGRYRISIGAFGNKENAEGLLRGFRDQGYPVFLGRQGTLFIVLVGPYELLKDAELISGRIEEANNGVDSTLIYTYDPNEDTSIVTQIMETSDPGLVEPNTGQQQPVVEEVIEQQGEGFDTLRSQELEPESYLQVGAYASLESARPQLDRLTELGYSVGSREEGGLVKLLVGPLSTEEISLVRTKLLTDGIDSFIR